MEVGNVLLMAGLAYALGLLWYTLLPARVPAQIWRVAAYPFLGIFVAEMLLAPAFGFDPSLGGIHFVSAIIGSIVAVVVDWVIADVRKPAVEAPVARAS